MPKVTVIPQTINPLTRMSNSVISKRRVAAYARVSTDQEEQTGSYQAQVDYYTNYIKSRPDWEYVDIYTDEGISGTNTKKRLGFQKMIKDALDGKIDLIVTKSVSRFARNTVDSLVTIRKLKEKGVECFFEKENIYTFDSKGELMITLMSSLAQEESRSISENVTWGKRKSFSDGKVQLPFSSFLGYDMGPDGKPVINEDEACVVRKIYSLFIMGRSVSSISQILTDEGIKTPRKKDRWMPSTVRSILTNEKYKGDALLQKRFTVDFLQKKTKVNEGEVPQYYVKDNHPAIISPHQWEEVQAEMKRRDSLGATYSSKSVFSSKLVCEDCGGFYGQKVWHSNSAFKKYVWQCNNKFKNERKCMTPHLKYEEIEIMFLKAYNQLMGNRKSVIEDCEMAIEALDDTTELDIEIRDKTEEIEVFVERVRKLVETNASSIQDQNEYLRKYNKLVEAHDNANSELQLLLSEKNRRELQGKQIQAFIERLKTQPLVLESFDETIWLIMVEKGIVHHDKSITFRFLNGTEIRIEAE